jgi:hypothetical protein
MDEWRTMDLYVSPVEAKYGFETASVQEEFDGIAHVLIEL